MRDKVNGSAQAPRMIDVARLAGVSQQTVSRVLNGNVYVSRELRERVEQAVRHLGYRRNKSARALVTNETMHLGVITVGTAQYGPSRALFGVALQARSRGYATSLVSLDDANRANMRQALDHLLADGVDGIIILAPTAAAADASESLDARVPLVMFQPGAVDGLHTVSHDEMLGACIATQHLVDLGHPTVHHLAGPTGWLASEARIEGWRTTLGAAGKVAVEPRRGDWSAASGYTVGLGLLQQDKPTAVFVANDQMALGLLKAAAELGIRVPEALSVVGFDDIPESQYFCPSLTTMRLDFDEVGRRCVDRVINLIRHGEYFSQPVVAPYLIPRASTARHEKT
ncbi:LacI family DNA-binding transcriptional regulator [Hoyosella sp. YIM 151337]|uniref:LacI family DNA-binding transcriptional regulator n=1 Tax=Hoyosella sp. YIM 151337 TaxID=2992742 RepID=UPI002235EE56|nr:LacI family DNA-binding transcriptional regulator [Hoyosella sp. YIM 151337]MCW4354078.1 LacI family DNA-binding transcriptional regulator [Hoyosella sp. YIM 151337]